MTDNDSVNHPSHYTAYKGLEIIDLTEQMNFNKGNAVKYIARAGLKNPDTEIEDLEKACWYIRREIDRVRSAGAPIASTRKLEEVYAQAEQAMRFYEHGLITPSAKPGQFTKVICSSCDAEMREYEKQDASSNQILFVCDNNCPSFSLSKFYLKQYYPDSIYAQIFTSRDDSEVPSISDIVKDEPRRIKICPDCGILLEKHNADDSVKICTNKHGWMEYTPGFPDGVWHPWETLGLQIGIQTETMSAKFLKSSCGRDGCIEHQTIEG